MNWLFALGFLPLVLVPLFKKIKLFPVDKPNERSSHVAPTPRSGGLAFIPVMVGVAIFYHLYWLLAATLVIAMISYWDDRRNVNPLLRLICHIGAAVCAAYPIPEYRWIWAFLFLVSINVTNFYDGLNGIVTFQKIGIFLVGSFLIKDGAFLPLILMLIFFLPFNFPKARVFMGDVGSASLGLFAPAFLAYQGVSIPWVLVGYSLMGIDAGWTILWRIFRGNKIWEAHRLHAYQQVTVLGLSHTAVTLSTFVLTLLGGVLAWVYGPWFALFDILIGFSFLWFSIQRLTAIKTSALKVIAQEEHF